MRQKEPLERRITRIALVILTILTFVEIVIAHIKTIIETLTR